MSKDLTGLLNEWPHDPEQTMRIIVADDGRSVLQVRLPLGIEQYELTGRPDGARPFDKETVLEELDDRLQRYRTEHGTDEGFTLSHEDCILLQSEGVLYYYRYLLLFQLNDFERVVADTDHNLLTCTMLEKYCENDEDKNAVLQYKPYILRMNAMARAMESIHEHLKETAQKILISAISEIESMEELESPAFQFERIRSLNYLRSALKQIDERPATDPRQMLETELTKAIEDEDYEKAAEIRDKIRELS
ncbi:MAG TPA: UvrB/UvrC motif-containing protein [Spirochaetia bacterium]|nr:UvrB/UvrC motif-containing protein [Spirochaetia bacterium]